jgi:hypothetical protein
VKLAKYLTAILIGIAVGTGVRAQMNASFAVFDFEAVPSGVDLVVGIQPDAARALSGSFEGTSSTFQRIEGSEDVLVAYIQSSVSLSQHGEQCSWNPELESLAADVITLHADGVTFRGHVICPSADQPIVIQTDLFQGMLTGHRNLVRMKMGDGAFRVIDELNASHDQTSVDPKWLSVTTSAEGASVDRIDFTWIILGLVFAVAIGLGLRRAFR